MAKVYYDTSMSLDGFITAANPRPEAGLGDDGLQLFEWTNSADPRNREIVQSGSAQARSLSVEPRTTFPSSTGERTVHSALPEYQRSSFRTVCLRTYPTVTSTHS